MLYILFVCQIYTFDNVVVPTSDLPSRPWVLYDIKCVTLHIQRITVQAEGREAEECIHK